MSLANWKISYFFLSHLDLIWFKDYFLNTKALIRF